MFESAKLKVEWADHHISDLATQFQAFVESNPYSVAVGHNPETRRTAIRLIFKKPIPKSFALTIGDAIHNLRCALDHMTWQLVGRDGGTQNRYLKLPAGQNRIDFEAACKGIITPSQAIIDLLKSLEVFPSGKGDVLYKLHLLDNADKHTVLAPVIRAAQVSKLAIFDGKGVPSFTRLDCIFAGDNGELFADVLDIPEGGHVEIDNDTKATPFIFLGNVQGVPTGPVFESLSQFRHATAYTLDIVAKAIS